MPNCRGFLYRTRDRRVVGGGHRRQAVELRKIGGELNEREAGFWKLRRPEERARKSPQ
jgi:hypothetical protein